MSNKSGEVNDRSRTIRWYPSRFESLVLQVDLRHKVSGDLETDVTTDEERKKDNERSCNVSTGDGNKQKGRRWKI